MTDAYNNATVPGSGVPMPDINPGCKHYIIVNAKSEIVGYWSSGIVPNQVPGQDDILIRENGGTQFRLFDDGPENERIAMHTEYGDISLYKWTKDREIIKRTDAEINSEFKTLLLAALPGQVRSQRDGLLKASDWTQLADTALTPEEVKEWAVYRQELRDVTKQPGFPEVVEWPAEPE
jgi:hypothetical protein